MMPPEKPARMQRQASAVGNARAFSLVEILVCMVVIGALALLLMPAIQGAKDHSRSVRCLSNLRSLWQGGMLYVQDHNGRFCSLNIEKSKNDAKSPGFREYLGYTSNLFQETLYTCPKSQAGELAAGGNMFRSYAVNRLIVSNWAPANSGTTEVNGAVELLVRIQYPGRTLYITEGVPNAGSSTATPSGKGINYFSNINSSNFASANYIHSGRLNAVFLDGHTAALQKSDLDKPKDNVLWGGNNLD